MKTTENIKVEPETKDTDATSSSKSDGSPQKKTDDNLDQTLQEFEQYAADKEGSIKMVEKSEMDSQRKEMEKAVQDKEKEDKTKEEEKENPKLFEGKKARGSSSFCSRIFLSYMNPMIDYTNRTDAKLSLDSYGEIADADKMDGYFDKLEKKWKSVKDVEGKTNDYVLFKILFSTFGDKYVMFLFWNTLQTLVGISDPFLIKTYIEYIRTGKNEYEQYFNFWDLSEYDNLTWLTRDMQYGFAIVLAILMQKVFSNFVGMYVGFEQHMHGMKSTNALKQLIYKKQLRLSNATNKKYSTGDIIHFIEHDSGQLYWLNGFMSTIIRIAIMMVYSLYSLISLLGMAFIGPIIFMFGSIWANRRFGESGEHVWKALEKAQSARTSLTTECLGNMKILKVYGWTDIFKKMIITKRDEELKHLDKDNKQDLFNIVYYSMFPQIVRTASLSCFIFYKGDLKLSDSFFIISVLGMVERPMHEIPGFFHGLKRFQRSMIKLQDFLNQDECDLTLVKRDFESKTEDSIVIRGSNNFHWGAEMKKEPKLSEEEQEKKDKEEEEKERAKWFF